MRSNWFAAAQPVAREGIRQFRDSQLEKEFPSRAGHAASNHVRVINPAVR